MKKIISCLILCAMLLSVFPISAFAGGETDNSNEVSMTTLYNPDAETHTLDLSGYTAGTHEFIISSNEEMVYFNKLITNGKGKMNFDGFTVRLKADIDLSGRTLEKNSRFVGTFDGEGHTISGLTMNDGRGLFGYAVGNISNFTLSGASITNSSGNTGAIVGDSNDSAFKGRDLTISNVHVINSTISGTSQVGGIMGATNDSSATDDNTVIIKNCSFNGVVTGTGSRVAGIVGYGVNTTQLTISNCSVSLEGSTGSATTVGKLVGETKIPTTLNNCIVAPSNYNPDVFVKGTNVVVDDSTCSVAESDTRYYGFQNKTYENTEGDTVVDYRIVGTLDAEDLSTLSDVGFYVTLTYGGATKVQKVSCKAVYSSVKGGNITYKADEGEDTDTVKYVDGDYLFVLVIPGVPADVSVDAKFTPYMTDANGITACGSTQAVPLVEKAS